MSRSPLVSVIIPTRNRAALLREAIESVRAQTVQDWELIVVDDGSTDATSDVVATLRRQDPRIRYTAQAHQGAPLARASGLAFARGTFVAFLDDDDLFLPEKLKRQLEYLDAHPQVGLVYSSVDVVDAEHRFLERLPGQPAQTYFELIDDHGVMTTQSVLVRRRCFDALGTFRAEFPMADDYEMWLRISRAYPIAFLAVRVGVYRRHRANLTNYLSSYTSTLGVYRFLLQSQPSGEERRHIMQASARVKRECALSCYCHAAEMLKTHRYGAGITAYAQAIFYDPFIGVRVPWGQSKSLAYRLLRPYAALVYCGVAALRSCQTSKGTVYANS